MRISLWSTLQPAAVLLAVAGGIAVTIGIGSPLRSALSYLGGLGVALAVVAASTWLVSVAAVRSPVLSLAVSLACYLATVVGFALALIAVDPTVIEIRSLAAGLGAAAIVVTIGALSRASADLARRPRDGLGEHL